MSLHILCASPFAGSCLEECARVIAADDALLLSGDGVYAALGEAARTLHALHAAGVTIFALAEDCTARGIDTRLPGCITTVDYGGFVDLVAEHRNCQSWL